MPRTIKDDSGNEIEVFEKSEYETALAEKAKAIEEAERKAKELEQEINPNWREMRRNYESLKKDHETLIKKAEQAGVKEESTPVNQEEIAKIASQEAEKLYFKRYEDRVASQFGDKREAVEKYAQKLLSGEKITEDTIDRVYADAARAIGISRSPNMDIRANFGRSGGTPHFESENQDQGFGTTEAGKATAAMMKLPIEMPKDPSKFPNYGTS